MKKKNTLKFKIVKVISDEEFLLKHKGENINYEKELRVENSTIIISPRMLSLMLDIESPVIRKLHKISIRTKKKRIRNKITNRIFRIIDKETN